MANLCRAPGISEDLECVDGELEVIGRANKGKLKEERKLGNALLCYGSECREEKE